MPKVLIADNLSPRAVQIFKDRGIPCDVKTGLKADELAAIIGDYEALAVRSATKVTAAIVKNAHRLKVIGRAGIGVDTIDVPAATARGIVVMNTPFGNSITTAEHAIALMFALARQIPAADRSTQAGKWEKNRFMGVELTGKTLGIVGCGNIGSIVADRAVGLKMKVIAYDPYLSAERADQLGVEKVELDQLFPRADFITLHTPLTEATRNLIDAKAIFKMKKGVRIINCARGGLIVEADLKTALDAGHVAGAALDVFPVEPAKENVLFGRDDVICTPHLGASTSEAQENVAVQVAEQIADFLMSGAVINAVNMASVSGEDAPKLRPYMALARNLGLFLGQLAESTIKSVTVEFEGHAAALNIKPLTAELLAGLMQPALESVNPVSAPVLARERGIAVSEVRHDRATDYQTLIRVTVESEDRTRRAAGTLIGEGKPRLVEIDGIPIEGEFGRNLLYTRNEDKPGYIGALGRTLGDAGVNIATMHLGRTAPGEDALCLVQVDQPLTEDVLAKVRAIPLVVKARALRF
ncbi:MAG: phosphoglycerate dehydrogenase [Alphaproteobacteria bacterium]|nr:phosphoglycerate dehydrogenase [Alphaproteobacteria bacterium]